MEIDELYVVCCIHIYKHIRHTYVCAMSLERQHEHLYNSLASRLLLQLLLMLHQFRLLRLEKTFVICYQSLLQNRSSFQFRFSCRAVGAGGPGGHAFLDFDRSVNPISTRGIDYALHSSTGPPDFQTFLRPCIAQLFTLIAVWCILR